MYVGDSTYTDFGEGSEGTGLGECPTAISHLCY